MYNSYSVIEISLFLVTMCAEENCGSSSDNNYWIYRYNWYLGTPRGRTPPVRSLSIWKWECIFELLHRSWPAFSYFSYGCSLLLCRLETTRHVSMITITLSKKELDASSVGWVRIYCASIDFIALVLVWNSVSVHPFRELSHTIS